MIESLFRRKPIREVLNQFSPKLWGQLIPLLVEIGVLFVNRNFRTTEMRLEDFKQLLYDLEEGRPRGNKISKREIRSQSRPFIARKPSGHWRKGDENVYTENGNLQKLKSIYSDEKSIYPTWWGPEGLESMNRTFDQPQERHNYSRRGTNQEEENLRYKSDINSMSRSKSFDKSRAYSPSVTEVYINNTYNKYPWMRSQSKVKSNRTGVKTNKSTKKIGKPNQPNSSRKYSDEDYNRNVKNAESKIRSQVIYDRLKYKYTKQQSDLMNDSYSNEVRYDTYSKYSNKSRTATPEKRGNRTNYFISYDKNLKPAVIREKSKDLEKKRLSKRPSKTEDYGNSSYQQRPYQSNVVEPITDTVETAKFAKEYPNDLTQGQDRTQPAYNNENPSLSGGINNGRRLDYLQRDSNTVNQNDNQFDHQSNNNQNYSEPRRNSYQNSNYQKNENMPLNSQTMNNYKRASPYSDRNDGDGGRNYTDYRSNYNTHSFNQNYGA